MPASLFIVFVVLLVFSSCAMAQPRGAEIPDTIRVDQDINYAASSNPSQTLDVYAPKRPNGDQPLPVIVNIHGGAFSMGDKRWGVEEVTPLVASGDYVGVSINYRLSGEAIWPAQVHDCKAAIRWVRANAKQHNMDANRIGVIGASAGGHLVAMLGLTSGAKDLEGDIGPHKGVSSQVQSVVDQFGPTDFVVLAEDQSTMNHANADSPEGRLIGGDVKQNPDKARNASPMTYVSKSAPPFLIIHGNADPLIPHVQSQRFYDALKRLGVEAYFVTVTGGGHGGFKNPQVHQRIRQFFDKQLRGRTEKIVEDSIPNVQ
jgi:acetyl esterase/lipase